MLPKVQVLLSTYNGEAYLEEQLQSLERQEGVRVSVLCRDDGSSDKTPEILKQWSAKKLDSFELNLLDDGLDKGATTNLGVVGSFLKLLGSVDNNTSFYAFCDQDDVWLKQKLAKALEALSRFDGPALYFSPVQKVTEDLKPIHVSDPPKKLDFAPALVEGLATGCTVVFNQSLLEVYRKNTPEKNVLMHDWWMHLLAHGTGHVVCDSSAYVLYRQHASNVVGAQSSFISKYWVRMRRFLGRGVDAAHLTDQAREFSRCYADDLKPEHRNLLRTFLSSKKNFITRLKWALTLPTPRQSLVDSFILRILIILNRY